MSAVDIRSGNYQSFLLNDMEDDERRVSAVMGSSSVPLFFPPRPLHTNGSDYLLMDGSTVWNSNLVSGI